MHKQLSISFSPFGVAKMINVDMDVFRV